MGSSVTLGEIAWATWNVVGGVASIIGLCVSLLVARHLKAFRREVLLRGALEDLEGKLGAVSKNLCNSRDHSREAGAEISALRAHVVEIEDKCKPATPAIEAARLIALIDTKPSLTEIINALAGLRAAVGHYRRDQRWTL